MQLDIFNDSRDTQLRNDLADSLLRGDAAAARSTCELLAQEYPEDGTVAPALRLIRALEHAPDHPFGSHPQAQEARRALLQEIEPAAHRVLGPTGSAAWLRPMWCALARRAEGLSFDATQGAVHAAALWLHAGEWEQASAAVARIPSWRRIPLPLSWMARARYHQQDLDGIWDLVAELAWLSARLLDDVMQEIADPLLQKLRERFDATFDAGSGSYDLAWFPAWLLTEKTSLAASLALAQRGACTPPEQAMRLLLELLGLERQGRQRDIVQRRKELRDAHAGLYACYMAAR
jgi:hypothetical protein